MRKRLLVAVAALCLLPVAATAAPTDCSTGATGGQCKPTSIGQAINATISQMTGQPIDPYANFFATVFDNSGMNSWLNWAMNNIPGFAQAFKGGGGSFGGTGASGSWTANDELCAKVNLRYDASANIIIPTIPLAPALGVPLIKGGPAHGSGSLVEGAYQSGTNQGHALWWAHKVNIAYGDKRDWRGVWKITSSGGATPHPIYHMRNSSYWKTATQRNAVLQGQPTVVQGIWENSSRSEACPFGGQAGGNMSHHGYMQSSYPPVCVNYIPNYALGPTGYAYPEEVSITFAQVPEWLASSPYGKCAVAKAALAMIIQTAWQKASEQPGYNGPAPQPVTPEDVVAPEQPTGEDMADPPAMPTANGDPPAPLPDDPAPTPTPTPTPTGGTTYDPSVNLGDPTAPEIDWWPDLPTIEVDLGSPSCPTYSLNLVGWWDEPFILDSHCPLIEQNRAAISVLMLAMFGMMSFFIVLRA